MLSSKVFFCWNLVKIVSLKNYWCMPKFIAFNSLHSEHLMPVTPCQKNKKTSAVYLWQNLSRGCPIIIRTDSLHHTTKTIAPRVKSQAKGQNSWSRALKWGIALLCSSGTFWDTTVFVKMWVFQSLQFCKKMMISLYKNAKNAKTWKSDTFYF